MSENCLGYTYNCFDGQEQNSRLIQQLREKDDANFKLMSERIKSNQLHKLAREEKDVLKEQVSYFTQFKTLTNASLGGNVDYASGSGQLGGKETGGKRKDSSEHFSYSGKRVAAQTASYGNAQKEGHRVGSISG